MATSSTSPVASFTGREPDVEPGAQPVTDCRKAIFAFDHDHGVAPATLADLLGGKGASLAEMTTTLGLKVPPGFTISVPVCRAVREHGWPADLDEAIVEHVNRLGEIMGRPLGDAGDPLLVAVRSGAPISMPGMLDTVLNLGLNDDTVEGLAKVSGDPRFAWDSYRRFLHMYGAIVIGLDMGRHDFAPDQPVTTLRAQVASVKAEIETLSGRSVPHDPFVQLHEAVAAVFASWDCPRARAYRAKEGIDGSLGTAVNVQAMVFGNRGPDSGTGVVFTRNPATGEPGLYGDYLPRAQGEDVVAGKAQTLPISGLREHQPAVYEELAATLRRLEVHYRDVCDVEFTVEEGRLWLLQTRPGKRAAVAAVRIAVDLVDDPEVGLSPHEAVARVPAQTRDRARQEILHRSADAEFNADLLATGLGASPGRAWGRLVLSSDEAADADDEVILVRSETSPSDVHGMAASVGVLTSNGGLVSHAAVVARAWGIPAVVSAAGLEIRDDCVRTASGAVIRPGEHITIDGTTGQVWRGTATSVAATVTDVVDAELPQLNRLDAWAQALAF